jgi:hypothetical protein
LGIRLFGRTRDAYAAFAAWACLETD